MGPPVFLLLPRAAPSAGVAVSRVERFTWYRTVLACNRADVSTMSHTFHAHRAGLARTDSIYRFTEWAWLAPRGGARPYRVSPRRGRRIPYPLVANPRPRPVLGRYASRGSVRYGWVSLSCSLIAMGGCCFLLAGASSRAL